MRTMFLKLVMAGLLGFALSNQAAVAGTVTASYSGTVAAGIFDGRALTDYPLGTSVSWQFVFDDAFRSLNPSTDDVFGGASQVVSGTATIGADVYTLNFARLASYQTLGFAPTSVERFNFQIEGSGPQSASGGSFFGVFLSFDPALTLLGNPTVGFGYTTTFAEGSVTNFGYLETTGNLRLTPNAVPLPSTALLVLLALAVLVGRGRSVGNWEGGAARERLPA